MTPEAFDRRSELDRTTWPALRDAILHHDPHETPAEPRRYPGYPRWPLDPAGPRLWPPLDRALRARRWVPALATGLPSRRALSRVLRFAHGVARPGGRGPVPSAGGLQALELYLAVLHGGWLPAGAYHYDRAGHYLTQLAAGTDRTSWLAIVPSLPLVEGGAILWVLVGDGARVRSKYGARGLRFLLLEAGHLMQNLCVLSASLGLATVPLGGFFEGDVARALALPRDDVVLYLGLCGAVR